MALIIIERIVLLAIDCLLTSPESDSQRYSYQVAERYVDDGVTAILGSIRCSTCANNTTGSNFSRLMVLFIFLIQPPYLIQVAIIWLYLPLPAVTMRLSLKDKYYLQN